MTAPANGIYRLAPYGNINQVIDISNRSQSDYALAIIYGQNSGDQCGNHQKVYFEKTGATSADIYVFSFLHSLKRLDKCGAVANVTSNAIQFTPMDYAGQWWELTEDTARTGAINGETLNAFEIAYSASVSASNPFCLDYANASTADGNQVIVYPHNDTNAQRWFFVPDCYYDQTLPVPADLGIATSSGGTRSTTVPMGASTALYPSWVCSWDKYQLRYRVRGRVKSSTNTSWGAWSLWKSPTGLTTHDGWGSVWDDNCVPTAIKTERWASAISPTLDWTMYDAFELQLQVRAWSDDGHITPFGHSTAICGASGSSNTATVLLCYEPTISCSGATMTDKGLEIAVSSDFTRSNNSWTLSAVTDSGSLVCNDVSFSEEAASGTLTVPWEDLLLIPSSGDSISFEVALTTVDTTATASFTKTVSYGTGSGEAVTASIAHDGTDATCTVSSAHESARYFLTSRHGARMQTVEVDATYQPPFASYTLTVLAITSSGWGFLSLSDSMDSGSLVWDFDGETIEVDEYDDGEKSIASKYSRTVKDYQFSGRDYHSYYFEHGGENDLSASGCITDEPQDFDKLKGAGYALFRRPDGYRAEVAITGGSIEFVGGGLYEFSIDQMERS